MEDNKSHKKKIEAVDYVGIVACLMIWNYIYGAVSTGVFNLRSLRFEELVQPSLFWSCIVISFLASLLLLYFVFIYKSPKEN